MSGGIHTSVKSYIIAQKTNEDETSTSNSTAADSVVHPPPFSVSDMSMASASYGLNICDGCLPMLSSAAKSMVTTTRAESLPLTARIDLFPEHGLFGKHRKIKVGEEKRDIEGNQDLLVTLKELINATGNFSKKKIIGIGSLGTVYKAQLQGQSKITVAVKKLSSHLNEKEKEKEKLEQEIKFLYALNHTNVNKLFDCHIEKDLQLLVYEYMEHRSLEDALSVDSPLKFTWNTRLNICIGIARGLEYLHNHPTLKFAHMNINAANILLDENFEPKISDFRLAHLYAEEDQFEVTKRKNLQGYMAPEYYQGILTSKGDVYSFGVILLVIVSWKRSVFQSIDGNYEVLVNTANELDQRGKLNEMVDKKLDTYDAQQALTILRLALKCTSTTPSMRPTMSDVVSVLLGERWIEDLSKSSPNDGEKIKGSDDLTHADSTGTTSIDLTSMALYNSISFY